MLVALPLFNLAAGLAARFGILALLPLQPFLCLTVPALLAGATLAANLLLPRSGDQAGNVPAAVGHLGWGLVRRLQAVTHALSADRFRGLDAEQALDGLLVSICLLWEKRERGQRQ